MMKDLTTLILATCLLVPATSGAEILSSSDTHFVLRHEAKSRLPSDKLWRRLLDPATWWHPDHTYSGDSGNLSLDAQAGGLWREDWEGGSMAHGSVLYVETGKVLRLEAPFGPLQALGAYTIWTITIKPDGEGSVVVFDEVSSGPSTAKLAEIAKDVDFVKGEAINSLAEE